MLPDKENFARNQEISAKAANQTMRDIKLLCHPELITESNKNKMLNQVQHNTDTVTPNF